jgi:hypothetical protein
VEHVAERLVLFSLMTADAGAIFSVAAAFVLRNRRHRHATA